MLSDIVFRELIEGLFSTMQETGADFTNTFRCLSDIPLPGAPDFDAKVCALMTNPYIFPSFPLVS